MRFDLGHDLDLKFSRSSMKFAISQPKMVWLLRNEKQTNRLNSRHEMQSVGLNLDMTLTLNFRVQIWNFLYLSQKLSDCHETKSNHTVCILGFKCDHEIWHDLDLKFSRSNMKFAFSQPKMVRLPRNEKQAYQLNSRRQMQSLGLTLDMTLTMDFQGQILKQE